MVRVHGYELVPAAEEHELTGRILERLCEEDACFLAALGGPIPLAEFEPSPRGYVQARIADSDLRLEFRKLLWQWFVESLRTFVSFAVRSGAAQPEHGKIKYTAFHHDLTSPAEYHRGEKRITIHTPALHVATTGGPNRVILKCYTSKCGLFVPAREGEKIPSLTLRSGMFHLNAIDISTVPIGMGHHVSLVLPTLSSHPIWPAFYLYAYSDYSIHNTPRYDLFFIERTEEADFAHLYIYRDGRFHSSTENLPVKFYRLYREARRSRRATLIFPLFAARLHDEKATYVYGGLHRGFHLKIWSRTPIPVVVSHARERAAFEFDPFVDDLSLLAENLGDLTEHTRLPTDTVSILLNSLEEALRALRTVYRANKRVLPFKVVIPAVLGREGRYYIIASPLGLRVIPRLPWVWPGIFVKLYPARKEFLVELRRQLLKQLFGEKGIRNMERVLHIVKDARLGYFDSKLLPLFNDLWDFLSHVVRLGYRVQIKEGEVDVERIIEAVIERENVLFKYASFWPFYLYARYRERGSIPWLIRNVAASIVGYLTYLYEERPENTPVIFGRLTRVGSIVSVVRLGMAAYGISMVGLDVSHPLIRAAIEEFVGRRLVLPEGLGGWDEASRRLARLLPLDFDSLPGNRITRLEESEHEYVYTY